MNFYAYQGCATCKKAKAWLNQAGIAAEERPIRERPPTRAELEILLRAVGSVRKLFNTSGQVFRAEGWSKKLDTLSDDAALEALANNGHLVKRPVLIGPGVALVGFDAARWSAALAPAEGR